VYFWYVLRKYSVNFFIFFIGLVLLYDIVDIMFNLSKLPSSSNRLILYIFYTSLYASFLLYPLALIFAFLFTLSKMVKFNELVSFYSLGFEKRDILKPFVIFSFFVFLFFSFLQSTKLAYASSYALAIKNEKKISTKDIFLRYKNSVVYIRNLNPILQIAYDMRVFEIKNSKLKRVIFTKEAFFKDEKWHSNNAKILNLSFNRWKEERKKISFLKNFKPKIISNIQELRDISFYDALIVLKYFQNVDTNKIFSLVFFKLFTPLLMIVLMIDIFLNSPIHIRISNLSFFMIKSILFVVFMWGSELLIFKFAKQGVLPFYTLLLPLIVVLIKIYIDVRRSNEF